MVTVLNGEYRVVRVACFMCSGCCNMRVLLPCLVMYQCSVVRPSFSEVLSGQVVWSGHASVQSFLFGHSDVSSGRKSVILSGCSDVLTGHV
jgi:hypothetical protein